MASFRSIQRIVEKNNLEDNTEIQRHLQKAAKLEAYDSAIGEKALEAIESKVSQIASEKVEKPFPEPTYPINYWRPHFPIGATEKDNTVFVSSEQLARHAAVLAQSGWGKTTLFRRWMASLSDTEINFTAFDLNWDYRHLANHDEVDVIVIPFEKLRWNILKPPPGSTIESWQTTVAEIFADSQALLDASENYTDEQLEELYLAYQDIAADGLEDVYEDTGKIEGGKQGAYPTLIDLKEAINDQGYHPSDPNSSYQKRVLNRIGGIIRSSQHTIDCVHGHDLETLLIERNVVIELGDLRTKPQNFFMELMYAWLLEYRKAQNQGDDHLRHVTFWDESKTIFSKYKERTVESGIPVIDDLFDRSRNFGEASIGADQEPLKLTDSFHSNTYIKILGTSLDSKQFNRASKSMGLDQDRHQQRAARNIDTPHALIKIGVRGPFKIKLPSFDVEENVTDELLEDLYLEQWNQLLHPDTPVISASGKRPEQHVDTENEDRRGTEEPEQPALSLSEESERLLRDIAENPVKKSTDRYELFSSIGKASRAKTELITAGAIEPVEVSKEDSTITLFKITDIETEYLKSNDVELEQEGRGGIEHKYWQHRIKDWFEEHDYASKLEFQKRDIYGLAGDHDVAVEVAMGANEREIDHLEDALERGYSRIIVACRTPQVKGYIKRKAEQRDIALEDVELCTLNNIESVLSDS